MTNIATHIRIFDPEPSDEIVEKRSSAIHNIALSIKRKGGASKILAVANSFALGNTGDGSLSTNLTTEIESAIKKESASFVREGNDLQIFVCALLAGMQVLEANKPNRTKRQRTDILAAGIWSAMSFQVANEKPKLEALVAEVRACARELVIASSEFERTRRPVPDFSVKEPASTEGDDEAEEVGIESNNVDWSEIAESINTGARDTIQALKINAVLDREELDLLWWALGDWSTVLNRRFSSVSSPVAAVVGGLEASKIVQALPGEAHKHLVLRNAQSEVEPMNLSQVLECLGDDASTIAASLNDCAFLAEAPQVFPLLTAISGNISAGPSVEKARPLDEWAGRALLESSILHVAARMGSDV